MPFKFNPCQPCCAGPNLCDLDNPYSNTSNKCVTFLDDLSYLGTQTLAYVGSFIWRWTGSVAIVGTCSGGVMPIRAVEFQRNAGCLFNLAGYGCYASNTGLFGTLNSSPSSYSPLYWESTITSARYNSLTSPSCPCSPSPVGSRVIVTDTCPINGWKGPGYYCVRTAGSADPCVAVELLYSDHANAAIEICSGPYATLEEAQDACPEPITICEGTENERQIPATAFARISNVVSGPPGLDGMVLPVTYGPIGTGSTVGYWGCGTIPGTSCVLLVSLPVGCEANVFGALIQSSCPTTRNEIFGSARPWGAGDNILDPETYTVLNFCGAFESNTFDIRITKT